MEIEHQVQQTFQYPATRFRTVNGEEMNRSSQILSERFQPNTVLSPYESGSNDQKVQLTKIVEPSYYSQSRSQQTSILTMQQSQGIKQLSKYEQFQLYRREHPQKSSLTNEILINDLGMLQEDSNQTGTVQLFYQININASCLLILKLNISRLSWGFTQTQDFCQSLKRCSNLLEFDVNLAMNGVSDSGSEIISQALGALPTLEIISLNLEKNNLCKRGFCLLEVFNTLPCLLSFSLDVRGNHLAMEEEITKMLVKFQSNRIFHSIQKFKIAFDEIASSQIQRLPEDQNKILLNPDQMEAKKQYLELKNQVDKTQFQIQNYTSEILQLRNYSQQLQLQGFAVNLHPQQQQVIFRINQSQNNLQMLLNLLAVQQQSLRSSQFQQFIGKDEFSDQEIIKKKKKTVMCRLLEIMLKFTDNLKEFSLSCPGELMNEVSWEYLGELLRNKTAMLESFCLQILSCARLGPSQKEVGFVTYQLGKLLKLHTLKLELSNLSSPSCLFLSRFLSQLTQLRNLSLKLPHLDPLSNQQEILEDLCNFMQTLKSPIISSIEIDIQKSIFDDNLALKLSSALALKQQTLQKLILNVKDCPQLTDQSLNVFKQMLIIQQKLSSLKLDVSQNRINSSILLSAIPELQYPILNLNLNLLCSFQTTTNSFSKILTDSLTPIHTLTTCSITLSRDSSACSRILIERALRTKRLLRMIQLFKATSPLLTIARKELSYQIFEHFLL